ncbi:DUF6053 domain-containing protein [Lysobacter enzymogenes]|uniref:DUF6053 domain-containing protein n=1 Tax=Lysobacter enzymogenes TaxID=69 RepID=UPI003D18E29F
MGGTSVPMPLSEIAAIGAEGIGTEVPPTRSQSCSQSQSCSRSRSHDRLRDSTSPDTSAPCAPG